jgi:redox-sensitive bicupin YhaK (pirin superfamily)
MERKEFIKGSAIIGASLVAPEILKAASGLATKKSERKVHQVISAKKTMVGTLPVLRAFAGDNNDYVSPYVFFDEFGPVNLNPKNKPLRVEAHPHAGIIPITYFLSGSGHHRDSLNYDFQIAKGDFMLFTSGRGAIHMEETGQKLYDDGGLYHGFQIWLNMPAKHKFISPTTVVHHEEEMGFVQKENYSAKVVLGEGFGVKSKIETLFPAFYFHVKIEANTKLEIPTHPTHNAFIYLIDGKLEVEGNRGIDKNQVVLYQRNADYINIFAKEKSELLILGGAPHNEPVYAYGPFVMNTEQEIRQCINDYQSGKMGNPDLVNGN